YAASLREQADASTASGSIDRRARREFRAHYEGQPHSIMSTHAAAYCVGIGG
ncbi:MAG: hypothetical protein ACI8W7_004653, partial [Gammaproteobacteria bacterium]